MAGTLNRAILVGRLGQDPKLAYSANGVPVANMNMATDESYTDRDGNRVDRTEWHRVVVFGKQAEFCANYLSKGRLVLVEGRLQTRKWQDQQGQDRYTTEVVALRVQALDPKGQNQPAESYVQAPEHGKSQGSGENMGPAFPSEAGGMDEAPF